MKKITLIFFVFFLGVVTAIFAYGMIFYSPDNYNQNTSPNILQNATTSSTDGRSTKPPSGISMSEVAKHNTRNDCYLVINNKVYDVSSYIDMHPGGARNISSRCGTEVTGIFASIHSNFAWDLLKKYYIGAIGTASANSTTKTLTTTTVSQTLDDLTTILKQDYPNSEVISVQPKTDYYVAKIIYNNALLEIHLDKTGKVIKEEVQDDENDWNNWSTDPDDD